MTSPRLETKKKILVLAPMVRIAMKHYLQAVLDETHDDELEVLVVAPSHADVETNCTIRLFQGGSKVSVLAAQLNPITYVRIAHAICSFRPDIVHVLNGDNRPMAVWAALVSRCVRAHCIMTVHDPIPHPDAYLHRVTDWIGFVAAKTASSLLLHSSYHLGEVRRKFGKPTFVFSLPDFTANFPKLSSGGKENIVLFFGRIETYKGIDNFVSLGLRLNGKAKFILAGAGKIESNLRQTMEENPHIFQIENRFVPDGELITMIDRAKVVIMPYHSATQSGIPAAAVARGAFPIGFAVGGLSEQLPEFGGIAVSPRDMQALSTAVEKTLELPPSAFERLTNSKPDFGKSLRDMYREICNLRR